MWVTQGTPPPRSARRMSSTSPLHAVSSGLLVAIVGFASSTAIVVKGLEAAGANAAEITSGLLAVSVAMGVLGIGLGLATRMPISIA